NCVGHWPDSLGVTAFAALVGHALGPLGAAGTAYLISVIQDGISSADPWHLGDGSPAPSLMGAEEVATGTEPEQSTGVGDRTSFTWPVELPSGARLLPIVAAPEPPGEASVNLTENAQATSPVNPIGVTSEPAADLTGEAEATSPVNLTDSTGNPSPVNLTDDAESTSPVNLTGSASERRESKAKQRKRRTRPARRSTSSVNRKSVEDRAR